MIDKLHDVNNEARFYLVIALAFLCLFTTSAAASNDKSFKLDSGVKIKLSEDAGTYYCEHVFYLAERSSRERLSSIKKNSYGDSLVGFLHVPSDSSTFSGRTRAPKRDMGMIQDGLASAIHGYVKEIRAQQTVANSVIRILLTGFGSFNDISDNPTEAFLSESTNMLDSVQKAFPFSRVEILSANNKYFFSIKQNDSSQSFYLEVLTHVMPVSDLAINWGSGVSILDKIQSFKPQAVISMGVMGVKKYLRVESRSSDANIKSVGGQNTHKDRVEYSTEFYNYSLWRAIKSHK